MEKQEKQFEILIESKITGETHHILFSTANYDDACYLLHKSVCILDDDTLSKVSNGSVWVTLQTDFGTFSLAVDGDFAEWRYFVGRKSDCQESCDVLERCEEIRKRLLETEASLIKNKL